jgi:hypothetical protein
MLRAVQGVVNQEVCNKVRRNKRPSSFVFAMGADQQSQLLLSPVHERHPLLTFFTSSAGGPRLVYFPAQYNMHAHATLVSKGQFE